MLMSFACVDLSGRSRWRWAPALVAAVVCLATFPADAAAERVLGADCSPTGDVCMSVTRGKGRIALTVKSTVDIGAYRLCVRPRRGSNDCRTFRQRHLPRGLYQGRVDWKRHFGYPRPGRWRATWRVVGAPARLGSVRFAIAARRARPLPKVACSDPGGRERRSRPRECTFLTLDDGRARSRRMIGMRWTVWSGRHARGSGTAFREWPTVRIVLNRVRSGRCPGRAFTRATFRFVGDRDEIVRTETFGLAPCGNSYD